MENDNCHPRCRTSHGKRCKCRCGGKNHGAAWYPAEACEEDARRAREVFERTLGPVLGEARP